MCIDANFERFSQKDSISFYLDKAKETGFNHIVVDVKGVDGFVLYQSDFLPQLKSHGGFYFERDWDYLQFFIDEARKRDLGVSVSATTFPIGSQYHNSGLIYDMPELENLTCLEYTSEGMKKIETDPTKVAAFMNPILPESREFALRVITEILNKYDFDGYCLDYCRFPDAESDFSQESKIAFEKYIGEEVENFPSDIYTYSDDGKSRIAGKHYKKWWEFRSMVIKDFITEVRNTIKATKPDVQLEYWAASWLHGLYQNGQNWASSKSRFYEEYLDDWASEDYYKTAFAEQLDVFITGTYLERTWGMDDPESIEYGLHRSNRDINGACAVYGSLYAQNKENFEDAVYLCLRDTQGLMVFDIIQVIENNLWDEIASGIKRAENELKNK